MNAVSHKGNANRHFNEVPQSVTDIEEQPAEEINKFIDIREMEFEISSVV